MRRLITRLGYADVMATIALFVALGGASALAATHLGRGSVGSAQLRAGAVTGAKVKNGSLTGADIAAASLGQVPSAARADSAAVADRATSAATATRADSAVRADSATRADGATIAASLAPPESVHITDQPGEPSIGGSSFKAVTGANPGFYRDREGVVHLQGRVVPTVDDAGPLFELPPGFRPAQLEVFFGVTPKGSARALVETSGRIQVLGAAKEELVSLDGLTWRAAS